MITAPERYRLICGDALTVLRTLPDASVHACITSPPYFNLRDYQVEGQMGMEKLHDCSGWATGERCGECFICRLTAVFSEVKRVLRDDGTVWCNVGDSYAGNSAAGNKFFGNPEFNKNRPCREATRTAKKNVPSNLKPKDLCLVPQRLALSLQADGWFVRSEIIWAKKNPMPESVTDRPTKAHEQVWMLSKSPTYFYDADAIREPFSEVVAGWVKSGSGKTCYGTDGVFTPGDKGKDSSRLACRPNATGRNRRTVWEINSEPFPAAHFATFPEALVEPCILAGCPVGGTVLDCFSGAGTTGVVCMKLGRQYIGIELNPEYIAISDARIKKAASQLLLSYEVPPSCDKTGRDILGSPRRSPLSLFETLERGECDERE